VELGQIHRASETESIDRRESFGMRYDPSYDPNVTDIDAIPDEIKRELSDGRVVLGADIQSSQSQAGCARTFACVPTLASQLILIFALAFDLPEEYFDKVTSHPDAAVALNYYPTLPKANEEQAVNIGSHTDLQFFTMFWQDQNGELLLLNRAGEWIKAAPV
jgi:hypothetical protein